MELGRLVTRMCKFPYQLISIRLTNTNQSKSTDTAIVSKNGQRIRIRSIVRMNRLKARRKHLLNEKILIQKLLSRRLEIGMNSKTVHYLHRMSSSLSLLIN